MRSRPQKHIACIGQDAVRLALLSLILIVTVARTEAQTTVAQPDSASARQAIEREWARIIDQCRKGDWTGLAAGFTPNGVYSNPDWPDVDGPAALRSIFDKEVGRQRLVRLTRHVTHFILEGDLALESAESTEEWRSPGNTATDKFALRYLYVWKQQPDGRWRILYLMETKPPPPSKAHS